METVAYSNIEIIERAKEGLNRYNNHLVDRYSRKLGVEIGPPLKRLKVYLTDFNSHDFKIIAMYFLNGTYSFNIRVVRL